MQSRTRGACGVVTLGLLLATSVLTAEQQPWTCPVPPVEPCAKRHGRLSSQNGIPLKIWLIGTRRVVALENDALPSEIQKYLSLTSEDYSYIFGDFLICPLEPDTPGHMRRVCVKDAEKLVVQPLRRSVPPFRILSTWPAEDRGPQGPEAKR